MVWWAWVLIWWIVVGGGVAVWFARAMAEVERQEQQPGRPEDDRGGRPGPPGRG
jgi:hypothetical protein